MLCQEQFENPFPVVAHLMYRCRRKDPGFSSMQNPFRKKNGGRVKNFNIATLTDMNEKDESPRSPTSSIANLTTKHLDEPETVAKRKKRDEDGAQSPQQHKRNRSSPEIPNESLSPPLRKQPNGDFPSSPPRKQPNSDFPSSPPRKQPNGAFKMTSSSSEGAPTYHSSLYSRVDLNHPETNTSSAFKKVDKSSPAFHPSISLFAGGLDPREILFQTGPNTFSNFPYPMTPVTTSYVTAPSHPMTLDAGHMTSAFAPSTKLSSGDQQLKMAEEYKLMRKDMGGFQQESLMSPPIHGARMTPMQYQKPPMDVFSGGSKAMPGPLLPFLPPSLAALSFPSQNWCAKCNASFRMTSDLVYHMRSHHKRETDPQKLKREEKLRCHICNETFRERHHLTRHMTSHQ